MATALQRQLATIAASSTHQLDLRAQKSAHGKSLLFEASIAASQSFESLYLLCYDGFRDLCALDPRFLPFANSLFSEQSKVQDRTQMTRDENSRLDAVLEAFITLVGPRLLLRPAERALEWLVRRFRIHEYNTECLVFTYLPYHNTPQFLALLSILSPTPPTALRFLFPYIQSPTNPPRRTIVYTAINTPAFFSALQAYMRRVVPARHQASLTLSFWASITAEAIFAILNTSSSGRKEVQDQNMQGLVLDVLPVLNTCMRAKYGAETVAACYTIVVMLATQAKVGDKVLDGLMEAVVLAHDQESANECLACLAVIAAERSAAQIPAKVSKKVVGMPHIVEKLIAVSKQCQVARLVLGCTLGVLRTSTDLDHKDNNLLLELLRSNLLPEPQLRIALSALVLLLRDSARGSVEHGRLLELVTELTESQRLLPMLQDVAKHSDTDLDQLGLTFEQPLDDQGMIIFDSDDENMADDAAGLDAIRAPPVQFPTITAASFLDIESNDIFEQVSNLFEKAVLARQTKQFLVVGALHREDALRRTSYLSFLARTWSGTRPVSVRQAAIHAAISTAKRLDGAFAMQHLLPYIVHALTDPSPLLRRSAATFVATISGKLAGKSTIHMWGGSDVYGKATRNLAQLTADDFNTLVTSMLVPILEESVLDPRFIVPCLKDLLEGPQTSKHHPKHLVKAQSRASILAFFASHVVHTPVLRVRLSMLPMFSFSGKVSDPVRGNVIIPHIREWCGKPSAEVHTLCAAEGVLLQDAERGYVFELLPRETKSVQLLQDVVSDISSKDRIMLAEIAFDRINSLWPLFRNEPRLSLAQCLLNLALQGSTESFAKLCRERALESLRNMKLDSTTLVAFLDSVPSAVQMPDGPPTKKRRRTSRNEMARVELSTQNDVQRLLQHLILVLELIEGSEPGQHPALFKNLFTVFGELPPLKQQSGSELVYLQSMILGSLTPIVNTLKGLPDTVEYQSAVRADLLIDCIRHSTSPQVQNSALLLIANLASWVPDLILHNLMPVFTFIGSTLLRQQDDYSAQVVDKTISRVVPQLASSLRSKHTNFLNGVSDLLLSFTAAFEHIPSHRRLRLFSELARTLGPQDSLSAIIALLADRYHNNKTHRRFSTDLLIVFDPVHTLDAFKGYLDLVMDAADTKPKISETLFGLSEKEPAQVESAIKNLLSCLADLATDERLRFHVTRAFRRRENPARPREVFASIVEIIIRLSKKTATSPRLYELCSRVLARSLDLLPTLDLVKSAELLLSNADPKVQVAATKAVELRAGLAVQNDSKSVSALLAFLPSIENLLQTTPDMDAKIVSVSCIDRIIERFGKKDVSAVTLVAQAVSGSQSLSSSDGRIRILSLLCLTSVVDVLEDGAISLLPTIVPTAFDYLSQAIETENTGLHNAVYTLLSNIVERLGFMFSRDYLEAALRLSHRSAAGGLDDSCDDSRRGFYQTVSDNLGAQEVFTAIRTTWPQAVKEGFEASSEHLELLRSTINSQSKARLIKASSTLFDLLFQSFHLRTEIETHNAESFDDDEIKQLDQILVDAAIAMVLKLNDATFRPFFAQLVEQQGPLAAEPHLGLTFYHFLSIFFDKFKSIVTSYSSYMIEHAVKMLQYLAKEDRETELRRAVLDALQKSFQHDQDGFWQAPSHYGTIMPPLLALLTLPSASTSTPMNNTNNIIPTVTELAAASTSSVDNHREMNAILLRYVRSDSPHTRLATVLCEQSLTRRLGEEWLGLLPEMLPFISELRDDDDEMVERETQRWITGVEEVLGESLEGMLQ